MGKILLIGYLVLLGCAPVIRIPEMTVRYVPEVRYVTIVKNDTLIYFPRVGPIGIKEVRGGLINYLLKDINVLLIYHFHETEEYTMSNDYAYHNTRWNGDWVKNIEVKMVVTIDVDPAWGKDLEVTIKWKFIGERDVWELYEITHEDYKEE